MEDIRVQHTLGEHQEQETNQTTHGKQEIGEEEMKEAQVFHMFYHAIFLYGQIIKIYSW